MALVAVDAVVDVSVHSLMPLIGRGLRMAVRALKDRIVARIGVAGCADSICAAVMRIEPGVVEGGTRPAGNYLVARLTGRGEPGSDVIGVVCS